MDGLASTERRAVYGRLMETVWGRDLPLPTPQQRIRRAKRRKEARKEEVDRHRRAAERAQAMIEKCEWKLHQYLADKGFPEQKWLVHDGLLFIPIRDWKLNIMSAQTISDEGEKRFLPGGRITGGRYTHGRSRSGIWVVEGLATALSVAEALKRMEHEVSIKVSFSAANLLNVARRGDFVVADHDPNQVGASYAERTGCRWWMPPERGDANDLHQERGIEELMLHLREAFFVEKTAVSGFQPKPEPESKKKPSAVPGQLGRVGNGSPRPVKSSPTPSPKRPSTFAPSFGDVIMRAPKKGDDRRKRENHGESQ